MGSTRSPYLLGLVLGLSTCPAFAQRGGAVPRGGPGAVARPPAEEALAEAAKPVVVMPEIVSFVDAPYPPEAKAAGVEGSVVLKLTIDRDGNVSEAEVLEPAGHGFDEAARDAALKFKFKPATRDGTPVPVSIKYRYDFTLKVAAPAEEAPAAPTTGNLGGTLRVAGSEAPLVGAEVVITLQDGTSRKLVTRRARALRAQRAPSRALPGEGPRRGVRSDFETTEEVVAGEAMDVTLRAATTVEGVIDVVVTGQRPPREVTRRTRRAP